MSEQPYRSFAEFHARTDLSKFPRIHRSCGSEQIQLIKTERSAGEVRFPAVPELVVGVVLEGELPFRFDLGDGWSAEHRLRKGDIRLCLPNTEARYECGDRYSLLLICLPAPMTEDLLQREPQTDFNAFEPLHAQSAFRDDLVQALAQRIWAESGKEATASDLMVDGLALSLVAQLLRRADTTFGGMRNAAHDWPLSLDRSTRLVGQVNRARDYIESNLAQSLSIADLAAVCAMSPSHFSRSFKAVTGEPAWAYVQRRRCERARDMLQFTGDPIASVALRCGFASQAHLTSSFKRAYGLTPAVFRERQGRASSVQLVGF